MVGGYTCVTVYYLSAQRETALEPEAGKPAGAVGSMGNMPVHDVYGIVLTFPAADEVCGDSGVGSIQSVGLVWNTVYFPRGCRVYFPMRTVVQSGRTNRSLYAFAVQYLPWLLVPRCTFAYHYFPSVPFIAMMVAYSLVKIAEYNKKWLKWCFIYLALAFLLFLLFYPVLSGQPILEGFARDGLRWMDTWQLVS